MNGVKIIFEDDKWVEYEFTQPNDLIGNTEWWTEEDWSYWKEKMDRLEREGTKGQIETLKIKIQKNPFLDGQNITGDGSGNFRRDDIENNKTSGPEIQSE